MMNKTLEIPSLKNKVSAEEWEMRVNLAAAYRLCAYQKWDDLIYTHLSARVPGTEDQFLINPLGLLFEEMTASALLKVDLNGNKLMDSPAIPNAAGFIIHSAIHEAKDTAHCIIHLHTDYGIAVSNQAEGLLPMCQTSVPPWLMLAYHDYEGFAVNEGEKERLVADMGDKNALILRNHGTLTSAETIGQAFEMMYFLEKACKIQILSQSTGQKLYEPSKESINNAIRDLRVVAGLKGADLLVWPALIRKMDRLDPSFRT